MGQGIVVVQGDGALVGNAGIFPALHLQVQVDQLRVHGRTPWIQIRGGMQGVQNGFEVPQGQLHACPLYQEVWVLDLGEIVGRFEKTFGLTQVARIEVCCGKLDQKALFPGPPP